MESTESLTYIVATEELRWLRTPAFHVIGNRDSTAEDPSPPGRQSPTAYLTVLLAAPLAVEVFAGE